MKNQNLRTVVEINEKSINIESYRTINNKIINVSSEIISSENNILDENGVVKTNMNNFIKKNVTSKLKEIEEFKNALKEINFIIPSSSYKLERIVKNISIPLSTSDTLMTKEMIEENFKKYVRKTKENSDFIYNIELERVIIDNVDVDLSNAPFYGKNLKFIIAKKRISKKVYESHKNALEKCSWQMGKHLNDMEAMFNSIERFSKNEGKMVVVNWSKNKVEAGYFEKGQFIQSSKLNFGINDVIEEIAEEINISFEEAEHYLYKNIDFSSANALKTIFIKVSTNIGLKSFTGDLIKEKISKKIVKKYEAIKKMISTIHSVDYMVTPVINFGLIQNIPDAKTMLSKNSAMLNYINEEKIIGSIDEEKKYSTFGFAKTILAEKEQEALVLQKEIEGMKGLNIQFDLTNQPFQNNIQSQLSLKNNGILIDKVEA